jgi:hypothetical protein
VTNSENLTQLLIDSPEDDITAYLLVDALMEDRNFTRSEATRAVLRVRLAGFDGRDLAEAASLISADSPERSVCHTLIFAACPDAPPRSATIVLVPGAGGPHATSQYRSNPGAWWYEWTITVGAAWLTHAHAENLAKIAAVKLRSERRRNRK